jgi:acyl-CoA synthetase (AMP-forming)/AMP-acid ligase II
MEYIMLTHQNLQTIAAAARCHFKMKHSMVLQHRIWTHADALLQMLFALTLGGTLILTSVYDNVTAIPKIIRKEKIGVTFATPSEYSAWFGSSRDVLQACSTWKLAFSGGENISTGVVKAFEALGLDGLELVSTYGSALFPVMASAGVADYKAYAADANGTLIPAGHPSPGYQMWIADTLGNAIPPTWKGEIWIEGESMSHTSFGAGASDGDFWSRFGCRHSICTHWRLWLL